MNTGYGETGSGLMERVMNKLGTIKGGQTVMVSGVNYIILRA